MIFEIGRSTIGQRNRGMIMENRIMPRLLSGFRDYSPGQVLAREGMMRKIQRVFELFGFDPLDTSTVEFLEILTGRAPGWDQMGLFSLDSSLERLPNRNNEEEFWAGRYSYSHPPLRFHYFHAFFNVITRRVHDFAYLVTVHEL